MLRRHGFSRPWRLTRRVDYLATQKRGRCFSGGHYLMFVLADADAGNPGGGTDGRNVRLGITVSKKVGNAVTRNRVKRWVRESYRRLEVRAPRPTNLVVVAKPQAARAGLLVTTEELRTLVARLGKR